MDHGNYLPHHFLRLACDQQKPTCAFSDPIDRYELVAQLARTLHKPDVAVEFDHPTVEFSAFCMREH